MPKGLLTVALLATMLLGRVAAQNQPSQKDDTGQNQSSQEGIASQSPNAEVTLAIVPAEVKLAMGEKAETRVVATNLTGQALRNLALTSFGEPGVKVNITNPQVEFLRSKGSLAWKVALEVTEGVTAGNLHFQLDYTVEKSPPGVILGTLAIHDRRPEVVDSAAEVRIETTLEALYEKRQGVILLIVSNTSSAPLTLRRIKVVEPDSIKIEIEGLRFLKAVEGGPTAKYVDLPAEGVPIPSQRSHIVRLKVATRSAVKAEKDILLFEVMLEQKRFGYIWQGTRIVTHKFNVGVIPGESEILTTILGVPSFLLLPGFLFLVAYKFFAGFSKSIQPLPIPAETKWVDWKSAEFWMLAISLSLLSGWLYPRMTGMFGAERNYLESYGLRDITNVWLGSIVAGVMAFGLHVGVKALIRWLQSRRIPSPNDSVVQVLRKLAIHKKGFALERVSITIENTPSYTAFVIMRGATEIWVGPSIIVQRTQKHDADFERKWAEAYNNAKDAGGMADVIKEGFEKQLVTYGWKRDGIIKGPTKVQTEKAEPVAGRPRIVQPLK